MDAQPAVVPVSSKFSIEDLRPEYWAFISYRHLDNQQSGRQWATWLHQQLESYEVPEDLIGKTNERGDVIPERIFPVFRDEEELPADADLGSAIRAAVERSRYMIVLCSPRSAESKYVAEEVAYFKQLGKGDRILAVMIEGEPPECFPAALLHPVTPDGTIDDSQKTEPIAADFRDSSRRASRLDQSRRLPGGAGSRGETQRKDHPSTCGRLRPAAPTGAPQGPGGHPRPDPGYAHPAGQSLSAGKARRRARTLAAWLTLSMILAAAAVSGGVFAWVQRAEAIRQRIWRCSAVKLFGPMCSG